MTARHLTAAGILVAWLVVLGWHARREYFGPPALVAFAGTSDNEAPLATFGRITTTVTSARQIQLGVKVLF